LSIVNKVDLHNWCQQTQRSPLIMGILNCTPDSFSDGGKYYNLDKAYDHAMYMIEAGADLIDIGGESSRPGATVVSVDEELMRVIPIIEKIRTVSDICISIDTYKARVMQEAVACGASMINDIMALQDLNALQTAAALDVPICLMHMHGVPSTMQNTPMDTTNLITTINNFFTQRITACLAVGIARDRLILDPGFGFGKTLEHNMLLMQHLTAFNVHNLPLLLGASRKSSLQKLLQTYSSDLVSAGIALAVFAVINGVGIIRTHDVDATHAAFLILRRMNEAT
jgi:dihydropteroate synthase